MEITEEQRKRWTENKKAWSNEAKTQIHTPEDLKKFADKLINHCDNLEGPDFYEETANATTSLAYAVVEMCAEQFGLSGFQVGCIMWGIIDKLIISEHDCGMKLLNYDLMLYPQYEDHFEKTIDLETWKKCKRRHLNNTINICQKKPDLKMAMKTHFLHVKKLPNIGKVLLMGKFRLASK